MFIIRHDSPPIQPLLHSEPLPKHIIAHTRWLRILYHVGSTADEQDWQSFQPSKVCVIEKHVHILIIKYTAADLAYLSSYVSNVMYTSPKKFCRCAYIAQFNFKYVQTPESEAAAVAHCTVA